MADLAQLVRVAKAGLLSENGSRHLIFDLIKQVEQECQTPSGNDGHGRPIGYGRAGATAPARPRFCGIAL